MMTRLFLLPALLACVLTGCVINDLVQTAHHSDSQPIQNICLAVFNAAEQSIVTAEVMDTEARRIDGYPYLRVNRFLSSFRDEVNGDSYVFWLKQLQQLANTGRGIEIKNLPDPSAQQLQPILNAFLLAPVRPVKLFNIT